MNEQTQELRNQIETLLAKPNRPSHEMYSSGEFFEPWQELFPNIYGNYSSEMDVLFIEALKAVRDRQLREYQEKYKAGELVMYILAGHELIDYGTSPRVGYANPVIADLWQTLIDRWIEYYEIAWDETYPFKE